MNYLHSCIMLNKIPSSEFHTMEIIKLVFIIQSKLAHQRGENTSLKLCEAIDAIKYYTW